jgi:hypothetical protein
MAGDPELAAWFLMDQDRAAVRAKFPGAAPMRSGQRWSVCRGDGESVGSFETEGEAWAEARRLWVSGEPKPAPQTADQVEEVMQPREAVRVIHPDAFAFWAGNYYAVRLGPNKPIVGTGRMVGDAWQDALNRLPTIPEPKPEPAKKRFHAFVDRFSVRLQQAPDDMDPSRDEQELEVHVEDSGGGPYFWVKTDRWAFDGVDGLDALKPVLARLFRVAEAISEGEADA